MILNILKQTVSGIDSIVEDTSPELGGDLDYGAYTISGTGPIYTGNHTASGTAQVVGICYGTGDPPASGTVAIGTLYFKYTP